MSFFTYAFVNMGMVSGILPVVGVPLPFVSTVVRRWFRWAGPGHPDVGVPESQADAVLAALAAKNMIGIIGVGNMGLAMAQRLRDGDYPVAACDIDPSRCALAQEAGCLLHDTPAAMAAGVDVLIIAVVDVCR
jgi:lactate dehydrogenase-like 2-hydroxyacid dehydrogenase